MGKIFLIVAIGTSWRLFAASTDFKQIIQNRQLAFKVTYLDTAFQYGDAQQPNMELAIKNISGNSFPISIPNGILLDEQSDKKQNQILVEGYDTIIKSGQTIRLLFHAYCVELHNAPIDKKSVFSIKPPKDSIYETIADWTQNHQFYNHAAQCAFWCVSDGNPIENIYNVDKAKTMSLWSLVAKVLNKKIPDEHLYNEHYTVLENIQKKMEFDLPSDEYVEAGIYDIHGKLLQTFITGYIPKGKYAFDYTINNQLFPKEIVYARLNINWSKVKNIRFALN